LAQDTRDEQKPLLTDGCPVSADFEASGYSIRNVNVVNPFEFLPWIAPFVRNARAAVADLKGAPFKYSEVKKAQNDVSGIVFLPDAPDQRIIVDLMVTSVGNCSGKQLDLDFWMLTSQIAPALSGTIEAIKQEKTSPQTSAGADAIQKKLRVFPAAGYNH